MKKRSAISLSDRLNTASLRHGFDYADNQFRADKIAIRKMSWQCQDDQDELVRQRVIQRIALICDGLGMKKSMYHDMLEA